MVPGGLDKICKICYYLTKSVQRNKLFVNGPLKDTLGSGQI